MQTAIEIPYYIVDGFVPDQTMPLQLMIDASGSEVPLLAIFDKSRQLKFFGSQLQYDILLPMAPLGSLNLEVVRCAIPTVDLLFFPDKLYETSSQKTYASYLIDDGVTKVEERRISSLGIRSLYRPDYQNLTGLFHQFPSMETVPLLCLLTDALATRFSTPTLFIYKGDREVTFWQFDQKSLVYYNVYQYYNPDEFNYYFMRVLERFDDPDLKVLWLGQFGPRDPYFERARKYVRNVAWADPAKLIDVSDFELPSAIRPFLLPFYLLAVAEDPNSEF